MASREEGGGLGRHQDSGGRLCPWPQGLKGGGSQLCSCMWGWDMAHAQGTGPEGSHQPLGSQPTWLKRVDQTRSEGSPGGAGWPGARLGRGRGPKQLAGAPAGMDTREETVSRPDQPLKAEAGSRFPGLAGGMDTSARASAGRALAADTCPDGAGDDVRGLWTLQACGPIAGRCAPGSRGPSWGC